eukprot:CAMPEP_0113697484 /NCGR_PEP_ID=MMETSP0038_2-20120614/22162_1 /TAXON_ID=2898 /ORGANISM="Cryptomonas paramecium" /LENGTH=82 /DNA_ID=CAMNT_0000620505 /DNA_START=150 /DNA_END=398 /DNA_ORIENTATION=+ /assembly_acc=CAM_ASM_000170
MVPIAILDCARCGLADRRHCLRAGIRAHSGHGSSIRDGIGELRDLRHFGLEFISDDVNLALQRSCVLTKGPNVCLNLLKLKH